MTFLNPAILFGLIAAAFPLILHLFQKRKSETVYFSSLMFLRELKNSSIKRIKIKEILLLIIRTLIIICIVLAFARPALSIKKETFFKTNAKSTVAIILDNSYSMKGKNGGVPNSVISKSIIKEIIENYEKEDRLLVSNLKGEKLFEGQVSDFDLSETYLNDINYSFSGWNKPVELINNYFEESSELNKHLYVVSDFQKKLFLADDEKNFLEEIDVFIIKTPEAKFENISIDSLRLKNKIFKTGEDFNFSLFISNRSEMIVNNRLVTVFDNGEKKVQKKFNLNPNQKKNIDFNYKIEESGNHNIEIRLSDDLLNEDNNWFYNLNIPKKIKILLVQNKSNIFINSVFQAETNRDVFDLKTISFSELEYEQISLYDVVFLNGEFTEKVSSKLKNAKSVIIFSEENYSRTTLNLLNNLGIICNGKWVNFSDKIKWDNINWNHPLLSGIMEKNRDTDIDNPEFTGYLSRSISANENVIIKLQNGDPFLSEIIDDSRRILVFNSGLNPSNNNLMLKPIFAPLINRSVYYVAASRSQSNYYVDETISFEPENYNGGLVRIERPDDSKETVTISKNGRIIFNKIDKPGIYKITNSDLTIKVIAVNRKPDESEQDYLTKEEIENLFLEYTDEENVNITEYTKEFNVSLNANIIGTEVWRYFIYAALILLVVEMLISNNLTLKNFRTDK